MQAAITCSIWSRCCRGSEKIPFPIKGEGANDKGPLRLGVTALCCVGGAAPGRLGRAAGRSGDRGGEHQAADPSGGDDRQHDRKDLAAHDFSPVALANSVRICNISNMVEITSAKVGTLVAFFATPLFTFWQVLAARRGWTAPRPIRQGQRQRKMSERYRIRCPAIPLPCLTGRLVHSLR